jgi:hypothetical protein
LLEQAGFTAVSNQMVGIHHWCTSGREQVHDFCTYLLGFIEPELPALLAAAPSAEVAARIALGAQRFGQLGQRTDGAISLSAYQGRGIADA